MKKSKLYKFIYILCNPILKNKVNVKYDLGDFNKITGNYILLSNHPSFYDFYFIGKLVYPSELVYVINKYYFKNKFLRKLFNKLGFIPKKLFNPDIYTIKQILKAVKNNKNIFMCPEGRLSLTGTNYKITEETGKLLKQLKLPIVITTINGAYLCKPKWRENKIKNKIEVKVSKVISIEEADNLSIKQLNNLINKYIQFDDFSYVLKNNITFKNKNKALGLENILYYCPHCHKEYTLITKNNNIKCSHCNFNLEIMENYHFNENKYNIKTINDWYNIIRTYEQNNICNGINLKINVNVIKYNIDNRKFNEKGNGIITLKNDKLIFEGNLKIKSFSIDINNLKALPFDCGKEFECYYNDELYYFYPINNKQICTKIALIVDEINNNIS